MARTRTNRLPRWAVAAGGLLATAGFWVAVTGGTLAAQNTSAAPSPQAADGVARVRADEERRAVWHRDADDEWEERSRIRRAPRALAPTSPQVAPAPSAPSQLAPTPRLRTRGS